MVNKKSRNNKTPDRIQAVWRILGGEEGVDRLLCGEFTVSLSPRAWREEDGIIYLSVTSDGATGEEWFERLSSAGFNVGDDATSVLRSAHFKPTNGVTYEIAILKGTLFSNDNRDADKIRAEADRRGFTKPNAEVSCLIRERFSDKELEAMGLRWVVIMHEPINDNLLSANRYYNGRNLSTYFAKATWHDDNGGFAFVVSQRNK